MKVPLLVFLAFEVLCGACTQAQDVSDSTPVLRGGATLVLVPTLINTKGGEPVFGLTASDFTLTDDGIEQKISLEENTDSQPLALVIVVQTGGAGGRRLDSYSRLGPLLDSMVGGVPHRLAVVGFDSEPHIEAEFTPRHGAANREGDCGSSRRHHRGRQPVRPGFGLFGPPPDLQQSEG